MYSLFFVKFLSTYDIDIDLFVGGQRQPTDVWRFDEKGQRNDYCEYFPVSSSKAFNIVTRGLKEIAKGPEYVQSLLGSSW